MRNKGKGSFLPLIMALLGSVAMLLRRQLYLTAVDGKGLLVRHTPLGWMLLALTAAVLCAVWLVLRKDRGNASYEDNYSASIPAALGHLAAAAGMFTLVSGGVSGMAGGLGLLWLHLGQAAPVCLVLAGILRLFGKKPFFLFHVIPCLFLMVHMVGSYQLWSSNPQLQDYLFALLAVISLILFAHYTAAFAADLGNRKMVLFSGMAAVYLCLAELGWTDAPGFYLGGMLWALTGICKIAPPQAAEKD